MRLPLIRGLIERRVLVNYRVDPAVLASILPAPFRPAVYHGFGLAGICLIRLRGVRPRFLPACLGLASENAAHRFAVEWNDEAGNVHTGVFVRRRDTNSRLNALVGGQVFLGYHSHATFTVAETETRFSVAVRSDDDSTRMSVEAELSEKLPATSVFPTTAAASDFFAAGSLGYSVAPDAGRFQGLELRCRNWHVEPLAVTEVRSSLFDDRSIFPAVSIAFDCALLMRGIEHEWHGRPDLCCASASLDE